MAKNGRERQTGARSVAAAAAGGLDVRSPHHHTLHPTAGKILAAAKRILIERGYAAMTLQAISEEAGVNKAGVWYYFGGKRQLVEALLEDVLITESLVFGSAPPAGAGLPERVDLIVGSAKQVGRRVRRFAAFYELLPHASRDQELHAHLMRIYDDWYRWAAAVLATPEVCEQGNGQGAEGLGQFASVLLDGVFLQTIIAAPSFDLEAALENARRALLLLASAGSGGGEAPPLGGAVTGERPSERGGGAS